jgi:hypothetical protein
VKWKTFKVQTNKGYVSMKRLIIIDIISAVLLLLLLYTAISKLIDYTNFRKVLSITPHLKPFSRFIAISLPAIELAIAILLFFPTLRIKGLYASMVLLILFTIYLIYMISFTPKLPCSCGGVLKDLTWREHVLFNLFFIFLALVGIVLAKRSGIERKRAPT